MEEDWADVMPQVPLQGGVPLIYDDKDEKGFCTEPLSDIHAMIYYDGTIELRALDDWLVDLEHPQGLRYVVCEFVLPWWIENKPTAGAYKNVLEGILYLPQVRDQRIYLEIARLCRDIMRGEGVV